MFFRFIKLKWNVENHKLTMVKYHQEMLQIEYVQEYWQMKHLSWNELVVVGCTVGFCQFVESKIVPLVLLCKQNKVTFYINMYI